MTSLPRGAGTNLRLEQDGVGLSGRSLLEWLTLGHVAGFIVGASWAFGGEAAWLRVPWAVWGSLGALLTLAAALKSGLQNIRRKLVWLVPLIAFDALVLVASFNPSFSPVVFEGDVLYAATGANSNLPSSAEPTLARLALWEFNAIWISAFNIALIVRTRRTLRLLLLIVALNATVLAVFGTIQKLSGSTGLYFGAIPSPQRYFFASFVYHNHWGAFALLAIGASLALTRYFGRHHRGRGPLHSPVFTFGVLLVLLAASIPLSASRSCTVVLAALLGLSGLAWLGRLFRRRQHENESILPPLLAAGVIAVAGVAAIWFVAGDTLRARFELTRQQVRQAQTDQRQNARLQLYRDTLAMAAEKPWFGWGMDSYPRVFTVFNTRVSVDRLPVFYQDAHSDWLQALAEHGRVGTALLIALALVPLWSTRRLLRDCSFAHPLLAACGLLVLYAALEFPFGNFAVVLTWWTVFHCALRYAEVTATAAASNNRT